MEQRQICVYLVLVWSIVQYAFWDLIFGRSVIEPIMYKAKLKVYES